MIASLSNDCVWSASICPSSDDGFLSYYHFLYKRPPFEGGRECNPDGGFQRPWPTFLSKDLSGGRDCYPDKGFAAKAHLLFKKTTVSLRFISGRVHIPMKVSWPMPTFLTNKTTYTRGPRLLSRLRFQAVMAHLFFFPTFTRGGILKSEVDQSPYMAFQPWDTTIWYVEEHPFDIQSRISTTTIFVVEHLIRHSSRDMYHIHDLPVMEHYHLVCLGTSHLTFVGD